jgi:hypothetical protein
MAKGGERRKSAHKRMKYQCLDCSSAAEKCLNRELASHGHCASARRIIRIGQVATLHSFYDYLILLEMCLG